MVNRDEETYVITVPTNLKARITKGDSGTASFPRSTINRTVDDFRALLISCSRPLQEHQDPPGYLPGIEPGRMVPLQRTSTRTRQRLRNAFGRFCSCVPSSSLVGTRHMITRSLASMPKWILTARAVLKITQEQFLLVIIKAQNEAVSVLLQVLYALHQGHVQFLMGDYRTRVLDIHGPDAFPQVRAQRLGKDGLPRTILDGHAPAPTPSKRSSTCQRMTTANQRIPKTH
jgi:hypothetical protein